MPDKYDIQDKYGLKVGEVRRVPDYGRQAEQAVGTGVAVVILLIMLFPLGLLWLAFRRPRVGLPILGVIVVFAFICYLVTANDHGNTTATQSIVDRISLDTTSVIYTKQAARAFVIVKNTDKVEHSVGVRFRFVHSRTVIDGGGVTVSDQGSATIIVPANSSQSGTVDIPFKEENRGASLYQVECIVEFISGKEVNPKFQDPVTYWPVVDRKLITYMP